MSIIYIIKNYGKSCTLLEYFPVSHKVSTFQVKVVLQFPVGFRAL